MHVPAALELWAAQHSDQLSQQTVDEVLSIVAALSSSELAEVPIDAPLDLLTGGLEDVFAPTRRKRAETLIPIVAEWATKQPRSSSEDPDRPEIPDAQLESPEPDMADVEPAGSDAPAPEASEDPVSGETEPVRFEPLPPERLEPNESVQSPPAEIEAPAFLASDRVDEEDNARLYGPRGPWMPILGTLIALGLLAGAAFLGWTLYQRATDTENTASDSTPEPTVQTTVDPAAETPDAVEETQTPETPTVPPTAEPLPEANAYWADTTPILNSGSSLILSSTYVVSPSNRAVLTGHTAGITGIVVTDDGRVLTSGADRRLVDWGADVTIANPDVVDVPAALTVLERTADERLIAGDVDGMVAIIDLSDPDNPISIPVHSVPVSAATELADGRIAVASVDGDVSVFAIEDPDTVVELPHSAEVTAVVGLPDSTVATASVDGIIRLWPADGSAFSEIDVLGSPATALTSLIDGRLAAASVEGDIVVFGVDGSDPQTPLGHIGAVRALFETTLPDGRTALASGGDDNTIRLWDVQNLEGGFIGILEGHGDIVSDIDRLPDGRLVSTSGDGTGRVWDLDQSSPPMILPSHVRNISAIHPLDNDLFVTGGADGIVVLSSTAETSAPRTATQHDAPIVGLDALLSGDIVSLDALSVLRVSTLDGEIVERKVANGATALAIRNGLGVVTGHADGTIRLHDFEAETAMAQAHAGGVNDVIVLSTGLVVSAGQDNLVRILDPGNPADPNIPDAERVSNFDEPDNQLVFDLHTMPVDVVAELPDGRVASASLDGIYIWSPDDLSAEPLRLNGLRTKTLSLVPLPGNRIVSTGDDGRVRLWDLDIPEAEPETLIDIPGVINPYLIQADNGLFVAGAARGYVVFTPN